MTGKTDYMANGVLGLMTDDTAVAADATQFVGLFTADPTDAYTGVSPTGTEVSAGTYARQSVTAASWSGLGAGTPGREVSNGSAIEWTGWDSGTATIVAVGIFESASGGEMRYWAELTTDRTVENGETATFEIGALVVNEN